MARLWICMVFCHTLLENLAEQFGHADPQNWRKIGAAIGHIAGTSLSSLITGLKIIRFFGTGILRIVEKVVQTLSQINKGIYDAALSALPDSAEKYLRKFDMVSDTVLGRYFMAELGSVAGYIGPKPKQRSVIPIAKPRRVKRAKTVVRPSESEQDRSGRHRPGNTSVSAAMPSVAHVVANAVPKVNIQPAHVEGKVYFGGVELKDVVFEADTDFDESGVGFGVSGAVVATIH